MAIIDDPIHPEPHEAFPVDNPIQALLRDHNLVRSLADRYTKSDSLDVRKQAAAQLLQAIHLHSRLEESVFYPAVRCIEPNLIAGFEEEHLNADQLLAALQGTGLDQPRADALMRELISEVLGHIDEEETELFPMLQNAALDLTPIGLEMQAFEANLVHMQAQLSNGGGMRR
jgi:hemerythrin superfamily protein